MTAPVLSVLIPAYHYAPGVERILARRGDDSGRVEYIVHDDSTDDAIEGLLAADEYEDVRYQRNAEPGKAIANWNGLLERAKGKFVVVVHHDEFPSRAGFFDELAARLDSAGENDANVYLLGLRRLRGNWPVTDKLVPDWLRFWLLRHAPHYLARRNFIGPSATFVVRRAICPRFDENLTWLVDVDFYLKTLQRSGRTKGLGGFAMISEVDRHQSITHTLGPNIEAIGARERAIITARLDAHMPTGGGGMPTVLEPGLWAIARLAGALCFGGRHGG